jgi:hypothetical protein
VKRQAHHSPAHGITGVKHCKLQDVAESRHLLQDSALAFSGLGPGLPRSARLRPPLRLRLGLPVGGCGCGGMSIDRRRGLLGLPSCQVRGSAAGLLGLKAVTGAPNVATERGGEAIGVVGPLMVPSVPPSLRRLQETMASLKQMIVCIMESVNNMLRKQLTCFLHGLRHADCWAAGRQPLNQRLCY